MNRAEQHFHPLPLSLLQRVCISDARVRVQLSPGVAQPEDASRVCTYGRARRQENCPFHLKVFPDRKFQIFSYFLRFCVSVCVRRRERELYIKGTFLFVPVFHAILSNSGVNGLSGGNDRFPTFFSCFHFNRVHIRSHFFSPHFSPCNR